MFVQKKVWRDDKGVHVNTMVTCLSGSAERTAELHIDLYVHK